MADNPLISAKLIKYTKTVEDKEEMFTIETHSPKFLDAEVEKHRTLSSNSSSSRAIPFKRTLDRFVFIPTDVRHDEKGMQGFKKLDDTDQIYFNALAEELYDKAIDICRTMDKELNIHKQHINRFIEPWTVQKKVITGNRRWFEYFLGLRDAEDADPNVQDLARKIRIEMNKQEPKLLAEGKWHIPYISKEENDFPINEKLYHSVARCARVSYDNFDGELSKLEQDKNLYFFLMEAKHLTPFEHQAKAIVAKIDTALSIQDIFNSLPSGVTHITRDGSVMSGNFRGYIQNRQLI